MITISRRAPQPDDVWINAEVLNNPNLSYKEKGLYCVMSIFKRDKETEPDPDDVDFDVVLNSGMATIDTLVVTLKKLCSATGMKYPSKKSFVYVATDDSGLIKIGHTTGISVKPRIAQHQTGNPTVRLLAYTVMPKSEERRLHLLYKEKRIISEWFSLSNEQIEHLISNMTVYGRSTRKHGK